MARSRLSGLLVVLMLGVAAAADAQQYLYEGLLTAHIGTSQGGEVKGASTTGGGSLAVLDLNGFGAEIDIAHFGDFDDELFADSSVTNFSLSFMYAYPHEHMRPFLVAGVGAVRLRATPLAGPSTSSHTEAAYNVGAGLLFMANGIFGIRGDVRYVRFFTGVEDLALRGDDAFDYWRTSVGVTLSWPMR